MEPPTPTPLHFPPTPPASAAATFPPPPQPTSLPPSPNPAAATPEPIVTPALAMRLGLIRRIMFSIQTMGGDRRHKFYLHQLAGLAQIVAWSTILGLTNGATCDRPLRPYLVLSVIRLGIGMLFAFYFAVTPPPPNRRTSAEVQQAAEANRQFGSIELDRNVHQIADMISFLSLVLFVAGNVWFFQSDTCSMTAPMLYKSALAALILSWLYSIQLVLVCIAVILFLPFFLIAMRRMTGDPKYEVGPLSAQEIEKIPQRIFVGTIPDDPATDSPGEAAATTDTPVIASPSTATSAPTRQWWRLWRRRAATTSSSANEKTTTVDGFVPLPAGMEPILLQSSQTACSICLCEYELPPRLGEDVSDWEPEPLRALPCNHAFHSPCLDSWLGVSGRCPLCQAPAKPTKKGRGGEEASPDANGDENV